MAEALLHPVEPTLTMPPQEADLLRERYAATDVILEYGSGGSTVLAASLPGRVVQSVESDAAWAQSLGRWFDANPPLREVRLHHADIGPTRRWGQPEGQASWASFHAYPLGVWDREDFIHPDLVLIDGRFRAACFLATLFRIERPVTVLWDDYEGRPAYHEVERYARPSRMCGRMAVFDLVPMTVPARDLAWIMSVFTRTK